MATARADNPVPARQPLRVLILEDSPQDAELVAAMLRHAGHSLSLEVTDSPEQFQQRLEQGDCDVILSDHNLRIWTGLDALEMLKQSGKDIPFIMVTGTLGDDVAVECLKQGATDYVLKDRLQGLPMAVGRALREKAQRQEAARLQEMIWRAKKEWEQTVDTVPDPVLVIDSQFIIKRANRAATRVLGVEFGQLIGRPCCEVVHGQPAPSPDCPFQRMLTTGAEVRADIEEPRLGKVFDVTATPFRDGGGQLQGCVEVLRDITERKRAERTLRESEEKYRALIENIPDVAWWSDQEGNTIFISPNVARAYGYTSEELYASGADLWFGKIHPADLAMVKSAYAALFTEGRPFDVEYRIQHKDGTWIWLHDRAAATYERDGMRCAYGVFSDITERKNLEAQLRQAQKMEAVGQLAGGVAHDFNNLLTAITGYSDLLLARLREGDRLRKHAQEIKKAGERAAALTRQLLAFSRRQVMIPQVLDLNSTVSNMQKMLRRLIGEDIELVSLLAADLGRVKADPGQMEQVLMNLAVNARDAMPEGGKLTIQTANVELDEAEARRRIDVKPGRYVLLVVTDAGCGMDAETLSHIFEPFYTTKEEGKGTGLGLATVYGIVKQSGGHIAVASEPGQGTTFKIYLPRVEVALEAPLAPGRATGKLPLGRETVLVVEDEVVVRELVREVLQDSGYTVLVASGAQEALTMSERHAPRPIHLLLTDVVMPEMDGPHLAERLARLFPQMKVLYMSGYADTAGTRRSKLPPDSPYLQKPFAAEVLGRKVREVLDSVPAER